MTFDELARHADSLGTTLDTQKFEIYLQELQAWNAHTNLTAITETSDIVLKHFLDSLTVIQAIPKETQTLIDIGSGAGFPGLVIAIAKPNIHVTLLEAVEKKTSFLNHIVETLELVNVEVIHGRAEDLAKMPEYREQFDVATARAVAKLSVLSEYTLPFVKVGGMLIAQKAHHETELQDAHHALEILGGTIKNTIPVTTSGLEDRLLIIVEKIKNTPAEYPRRAGVPERKPL